MKVGSIVECIANHFGGITPNINIPKIKGVYTIREIIDPCDGCVVRLEEIVNPKATDGHEYAFDINAFRELLPPMEIQDALDSCIPVLIELGDRFSGSATMGGYKP